MLDYQNLIRIVSRRYCDKIKKSCDPIFSIFNLNHFYYYKITNSGHFTSLTSNVEWNEYFAENLSISYPFYRHPENVQNAVIFPNQMRSEPFIEMMNSAKCKFKIHLNLIIINKIKDGFEEYGFGSSLPNEMQNILLYNELPLINLFIEKFRKNNKSLFSHMEDNQIDMSKLIGPNFYKKVSPELPKPIDKKSFLKKMGIEIEKDPSDRELDVIKLLLNGCSASKMAKILRLSTRTIEHHVDRIKDKMACLSRSDLIQKARELEKIGYFSFQ